MARCGSPICFSISFPIQADQDLTSRVKTCLDGLNRAIARRMAIEANAGVVTLRGDVPTFYMRQVFVHACRRIPGVTHVNDELAVQV